MAVGIGNFTMAGTIAQKIEYNSMGQIDEDNLSQGEIKALKRSGKIECETCKNRKYQDGSDDSTVSYQTPTNISASQSAGKVMAHEMEHYRHETAEARENNEEILSISVSTRKAVCPECGASYTAGGETRVVKRKDLQKESENEHFKNAAFENNIGKFFGKKIDTAL